MRTWSRGATVLLVALLLSMVLAFAVRAILDSPAPPTRTPPPTPTVGFPTAEPSFDLQLPLTTTDVRIGQKVTINGQGSRQIAYALQHDLLVAARLDCSLCEGTATVRSGESAQALFDGRAPFSGAYVLNVSSPRTLLRIDATGRWTLTLATMADLPPESGVVKGDGPDVVMLTSAASEVVGRAASGISLTTYDTLSRRPLGTASGRPTARLTTSVAVVVRVVADGPWTLEPVG